MKRRAARPAKVQQVLWDSVPDVMYRVRGAEGTIAYLGGGFTTLTGWAIGEWVGRPFAGLVDTADLPMANEKYRAVLRGERLPPYELRIRTKAGGVLVGEFHSAPIVERGRVVGEQGIARDITDRKRADEAREASEERFRALFESADEALFLMDGTVFIDTNSKCLEMFGLRDRSEMIGRSPMDYSPPLQPDGRASREKAEELVGAALAGLPQRFYWKHARKDGSTFDAEVSLNALTLHGRVHVQAIVRDITARQAAEQAVRESEERFRLLSEAAFEGIGISEQGRIVDCNEDLAAMLGYPRAEMIGRPVLDFVAPEHADLVKERHRLESQERYVHMARRKNGTTFHVEVQGRALPYQGRKLRVSAIRDISERRRSELIQGAVFRISEAAQTARSLEELFAAIHRIVSELMPARSLYIALYEPETATLSFPYFVDEFDRPPDPKPLGRGLTEYVFRTGQPLLATPDVYHALERRGEVELIGAPSVDWLGVPLVAAGRTTGVMVVQTYTEGIRYSEQDRDLLQFVSSQIAMAVERKRAEDALRRSEMKHRSLVEHAVIGIYRSTLQGRMLAANSALVAMLGYASERDLLQLDLAHDVYADPEERKRLVERYRDAPSVTGVEVAWKRKDGTPLTVRLSGRPTRAEDGTPDGFEMVAEDVTERRLLENQLRQAQRMEAVGQLAGGVAHDFNNLLTAVLAGSNLLEAGLPPDSPLRDDVESIGSAARRGAELAQKLLAFSRRQTLDRRPLSLGTTTTNFVRLARRVVPENVEIVLKATPDGETVRADAGAIDQILMNLVTNARDAMPGGGRLVIEVGRAALDAEHLRVHGWGTPGSYVTLTVSDTGRGMDAETRRRIFEPFFTTKPVGQGTGLGMSMVYGLVKQHEGFLEVTSEVGRGTTVRLYFPAHVGPGEPSTPPAAFPVRGGPETVLVVEDDEAVRRAATRALNKYGYHVLTASDGWQALEVLEACAAPPDLIISDVIMPRVSGPQLLSRLREAGPVPKMLFTSGYTGREALDHAELEPGMPLLTKPWSVPELLRAVRDVLDEPPEP